METNKYLIQTRHGSFYATIAYSLRDKVYFISVPAFPEVMTEASSLPEAKKFAKEIIELQCLAALDEGNIIIDDKLQVHGRCIPIGALALVA